GANAAAQRLRNRLPPTVLRAIPPAGAFLTANDKALTADLARSLGIATPRERVVERDEDARRAWADFGAPLVVKARHEAGRKLIRYVRSESDLQGAVAAVREASGDSPLAQEYVSGEGYGFSALYWEGGLVRQIMHRRVREWPPTGGTSACADSV